MNLEPLTAISPLDGRYFDKTYHLRETVSEFALIKHRFQIEVMWLISLTKQRALGLPTLTKEAKSILLKRVENFDISDAKAVKKIEAKINHDVKAVEYYLKQIMTDNESLHPLIEFAHFACTSEDINNLSYALMLNELKTNFLLPVINQLSDSIINLAHTYANDAMVSRTHGIVASPTTFGKEMANFVSRLNQQVKQLISFLFCGKMNGAVGNYNAHVFAYPEVDWPALTADFINKLGLSNNTYTTQIEPHDNIAQFSHIIQRINTILIDFSRDIWGYISLGYLKLKIVDNEVGSSTMPHKVNPIDFENSQGNLGIANALLSHLCAQLPLSRWQRDLTDSTQLRNLGSAFGHSLLAYNTLTQGIGKLSVDKVKLEDDLENNWEVITEAIQIMLRKHHIDNAYEIIKKFSRGKNRSKEALISFIEQLPLPNDSKNRLINLHPREYTGLATQLANQIANIF